MSKETFFTGLFSGGRESESAWRAFLRQYSNLFLKVIWQFEHEHDEAMEKYLFVCSRLAANGFALLRKYDTSLETRPSLAAWLTVVVRNLCVDQHRAKHGRRRYPKALLRLSEYDRKVFELYYWKRYSIEEIEHQIQDNRNGGVASSLLRIEEVLTHASAHLAATASPPVTLSYDENMLVPVDDDDMPDTDVHAWLASLPKQERLVVRLRFWEDLTAKEIAAMMKIVPEQRVYSILRSALGRLRALGSKHVESEKTMQHVRT